MQEWLWWAHTEKLRCQGFTVDGVTDMYSLYVIELDDTHIAKKPEGYRGYVYVGQTELTPEERARQHQLGPKYPWKKASSAESVGDFRLW